MDDGRNDEPVDTVVDGPEIEIMEGEEVIVFPDGQEVIAFHDFESFIRFEEEEKLDEFNQFRKKETEGGDDGGGDD